MISGHSRAFVTSDKTSARIRDLARARRAAVLAARVMGGARTMHVRRVTLLLAGETAQPQLAAAPSVLSRIGLC